MRVKVEGQQEVGSRVEIAAELASSENSCWALLLLLAGSVSR